MTIKKELLFFMFIAFLSTVNAQSLIKKTLLWDGNAREYSIYIPASYDGSVDFPLLFNFHGGGGDIASQIQIADMRPIADTANFILVYPQAFPDPTDGGSTNWIRKAPTTFDDVPFVGAMIDSISSDYKINSNRVYACGYSLGGELTYELACRLNNRIAAIGAVARTMGTDAFNNCTPTHPTGVMTILGTEDNTSPYEGLVWGGVKYYLSADEVHDYWANHNQCDTIVDIESIPNTDPSDGSSVERHSWSMNKCVLVEHLKVIGGGHDWPGSFGNMDIDASEEIWNFVSRYDLNGVLKCKITSREENSQIPISIKVYPNPVNQQFSIESNLLEVTEYGIYSILGELVKSGKLNTGINTINISTLTPEIYFLKINDRYTKLIKSN